MIASQIHVRMEDNVLMVSNLITVDVQLDMVEKIVHSVSIENYYGNNLSSNLFFRVINVNKCNFFILISVS